MSPTKTIGSSRLNWLAAPPPPAACACASEMKKLNKDSMSIQTLDVGGRGLAAARHYGTGPQVGGRDWRQAGGSESATRKAASAKVPASIAARSLRMRSR